LSWRRARSRQQNIKKKLNNYIITVVERAAVSAAALAASETDREMADLIPGYDKVRTVGKGNARPPCAPRPAFLYGTTNMLQRIFIGLIDTIDIYMKLYLLIRKTRAFIQCGFYCTVNKKTLSGF
jgi:hypothetical protein